MGTPPPPRPDDSPDAPASSGTRAPQTASEPGSKNTANRNALIVVGAIIVVALIASAVLNGRSHTANPAPPGFAAAIADGWKHGESLSATNVVTDTDRQDLCIVAGKVVGGPYDGQVAAWGVAPCSAVGDPANGGVMIAANDVAAATNKYGDSVPDGAPASEFRGDHAVQDAIDGVP